MGLSHCADVLRGQWEGLQMCLSSDQRKVGSANVPVSMGDEGPESRARGNWRPNDKREGRGTHMARGSSDIS